MKKLFEAFYNFFKKGNFTTDVQGLVDKGEFKNISTGLKWINPENLGVQIRTNFEEGRPNGFSFKIEKTLFFEKQIGKTSPSQGGNVIKSVGGSLFTLPVCLSLVVFFLSICRVAYQPVKGNGDFCGIMVPRILPSNQFRMKLSKPRIKGKPCFWYFLPTQYLGTKFKKDFLNSCASSVVPDFKNLVQEQKEVEKVLIFSDFRQYQEQFSFCLQISLGFLSVMVIAPYVRVITIQTVNIIFQKQIQKSYLLQLVLLQYSFAVTTVLVQIWGLCGSFVLVFFMALLFRIHKKVTENLKWFQNKVKTVKKFKK